jgi:hypothetical protein
MLRKLVLWCLLVLPLPALAEPASSKLAVIKDGVSNVVIGESLPYGNDAGWKNAYPGGATLKATEVFDKWNKFFIRTFLPGTIKDTEWLKHEKNAFAYFIFFLDSKGRIIQPQGKGPAILYVSGLRGASLTPDYLKRDSHGLSFDTKNSSDWAPGITWQDPPVNPDDPATFRLEGWNEFTEGRFEPWKMGKDLKDALAANGGKITMRIYVKLFNVVDVKTLDVKVMEWRDTNRPWVKHKSIKETIAPIYNEGRLIGKGEWTIVE